MSTTLVEAFLKKADAEAGTLYLRSEHLNDLAKLLRKEGLEVSGDDLERLAAVYARIASDLRACVKSMTSTPLT